MSTRRGLLRRVAAGLVLLGALSGAGLHHHEDLASFVPGALGERVLSGHSPLSHSVHWHSAVVVKDDPCLACQSHRVAGTTIEPCRETPLAFFLLHAVSSPISRFSAEIETHGSRGPPALL